MNLFLPADIKIEAEITGNVVKEYVSMVPLMKMTENLVRDKKPGTECTTVGPPSSENRPTASNVPDTGATLGCGLTQIQNDGDKSLGNNVQGGTNLEVKKQEQSILDVNVDDKISFSTGLNTGGTNDQGKGVDKDIKVEVEIAPNSSDCDTRENATVSLTQKPNCNTPLVVLDDQNGGKNDFTFNNTGFLEKRATLFTEGKEGHCGKDCKKHEHWILFAKTFSDYA